MVIDTIDRFAAAIEGMAWFAPCCTFDPDLVRATMAALLLWDLAHPEENTLNHLGHPGMLVVKNSFHGEEFRTVYCYGCYDRYTCWLTTNL